MAGRWHDFGQYNAQGVTGAKALGVGIERMVTGLSSSPDTERGVAARLRYLTGSAAGYAAIERAGIHVTARTLFAWLAEERLPNRANRARLDAAYWDLRRHNVAADLKRRLTSRGGTRIEIDPVDQTHVEPRHRRDLNTRRLTVRPTGTPPSTPGSPTTKKPSTPSGTTSSPTSAANTTPTPTSPPSAGTPDEARRGADRRTGAGWD